MKIHAIHAARRVSGMLQKLRLMGVESTQSPSSNPIPPGLPSLGCGRQVGYFPGLVTLWKTTRKQKNSRAFVAKHTKPTQQDTAKFRLLVLSIQ